MWRSFCCDVLDGLFVKVCWVDRAFESQKTVSLAGTQILKPCSALEWSTMPSSLKRSSLLNRHGEYNAARVPGMEK